MSRPPVPPGIVAPLSNPEEPAYLAPVDDPSLPRALLLGDSISIGYTPAVRERLAGRANVHRPADNCGQTAYALSQVEHWIGRGKWDVIHFNFGLHDLKFLDAAGNYVNPDQGRLVAGMPEYRKNLAQLIARLRATGARLIFATTTPVPAGAAGRPEGSERSYNDCAEELMRIHGIWVNDLWTFATSRKNEILLPHDVHFTTDGYDQLGELVAKSIRAVLRA